MHNKTQKKNNEEELDSPAKDDLVPEKLERPDEPLAEAIRFLTPLQMLASNSLSTHLLAFEIYYRKGKGSFRHHVPYACHYNLLLIKSRSRLETASFEARKSFLSLSKACCLSF